MFLEAQNCVFRAGGEDNPGCQIALCWPRSYQRPVFYLSFTAAISCRNRTWAFKCSRFCGSHTWDKVFKICKGMYPMASTLLDAKTRQQCICFQTWFNLTNLHQLGHRLPNHNAKITELSRQQIIPAFSFRWSSWKLLHVQGSEVASIVNRSLQDVKSLEPLDPDPDSDVAKLLSVLLPPKSYQGNLLPPKFCNADGTFSMDQMVANVGTIPLSWFICNLCVMTHLQVSWVERQRRWLRRKGGSWPALTSS